MLACKENEKEFDTNRYHVRTHHERREELNKTIGISKHEETLRSVRKRLKRTLTVLKVEFPAQVFHPIQPFITLPGLMTSDRVGCGVNLFFRLSYVLCASLR